MHLLVVANETVTGGKLIEAIERHRGEAELRVSVICPVSQPQRGFDVDSYSKRCGEACFDSPVQSGASLDASVLDANSSNDSDITRFTCARALSRHHFAAAWNAGQPRNSASRFMDC